jgi:tRNA-dihydrouridine synthase
MAANCDRKPLTLGTTALPNPVVLAPMSGITDAPFRRLAARLGAGMVVSEMTACAKLIEGRRDARLRAEAAGVGLHVVQLAGCEARWMAEGARMAEANGAADRYQHGVPGASRYRRPVRLGADAISITRR